MSQLRQVVQPWRTFTEQIMKDAEAVAALGWVREMWGYAIAAASLGIKHRVLDAFQFEGGSIGNRNRPLLWPVLSTPVGAERADMPYYILHYTYGIEYSAEGLPMELQARQSCAHRMAATAWSPRGRLRRWANGRSTSAPSWGTRRRAASYRRPHARMTAATC